jgi:DNA-directed RNA polymerase subunit omega
MTCWTFDRSDPMPYKEGLHSILGAPKMARITVEDCLEKVDNRYELVHLTTKRVKQLRDGADRLLHSKNKDVVTALREIAAEKVKHALVSEYDSDEF